MSKTAQKVASITKKMDEMKNAKVPTEEYKEVQAHIAKTKERLTALNEKMEKYVALGGKTDSKAFKSMQYDASQLQNTLAYLEGEMQELEVSGKAFTNQTETDAYKNLAGDLRVATGEMDLLKLKEQEALQKLQEINGTGVKKLSSSAKKASNSMKKLAKESTKANKNFSMLGRTIKQMALSMVLFQVMFKGIEFLKSGLQNLAVYSKEYNAAMSELMSSTSQLKNAFAVAFQPILNVVIPILSKLIQWVSAAANAVSRFFAVLGGKSTYTKAIKQNKDYAESLDKVGGSADETKGSLAGFDELEVMQKNDSASGGGSDGADASGFVEEEVGDVSGFEHIKQVLAEILDIFKTGFVAGLGDWKSRTEDICAKTEMIRDSLQEIFTDTAVVGGARNFARTLIHALGQIAGSVVSIGLSIGQNLIGGIAEYLRSNAERIKSYLVNMFDIGAEIVSMVGNFWQTFAYIFEAFGSTNGQQLTANLIGIFNSAFMGVTELCWMFARDVLNIITQPFIDNQEGFRAALEGCLGTAADVCGTIKTTIDNTFNKLLEVYNEHIKPFFDSVASGLSDLTGRFLEFWNQNVQPMMDALAAKFDEVMSQHIQPMINTACELIGGFIDIVKVLWENVLQPLIAWLIDNILPVILPIIQDVFDAVLEAFGNIADILDGFLTSIKGVVEFLAGTFTGDWERAFKGLSDIVDGFWMAIKGIINLVLNGIETMVNGVINGVNAIVGGINGIGGTVSDEWVPLATLSPLRIPRLANGGITTGSTLANIGEAGREAVIPLERNTEWMNTFAEMLAGKMGNTGAGVIDLTVNLDGAPVYKRMVQLDREYAGRTGHSQFAY